MPTIFVSYSRKDKVFVDRLTHDLENRQATVWSDRKLRAGEKYVERIIKQVSDADYVLAVHSKSSRLSKWVAFEVGVALAKEKQSEDNLQLLGIDASGLPGYLSARNALAMDEDNYATGLASLCGTLGVPVNVDMKGNDAGRMERSMTVFQAGPQWMELLVGTHGLECVLVDGSERRARVQWTLTPAQLKDVLQNPESVKVRRSKHKRRPWGTFDIGPRKSWRWSPHLFDDKSQVRAVTSFEQRLRKFLRRS